MTPPRPKNQPKLSFTKKSVKDPQSVDTTAPNLSTPNRPKRSVSAAELSPIEPDKSTKLPKPEMEDLSLQIKQQSELLNKQMLVMQSLTTGQANLEQKIVTECQSLASNLSHQVSEIKTRQDEESAARQALEQKVSLMQTEQANLSAKVDSLAVQPANPAEVARLLHRQVVDELSGQMKLHTEQVRKMYSP